MSAAASSIGEATMATKTKTKRTSKRAATAKAVQDRPARKAFAYSDRVAPIRDAVRSLGGSASVAELHEILYDGESGQFATPRRVAATVRAQRGDDATLESVGGVIKLIKRAKRVASKNGAKRARKAAKKS